MSVKRDREEKHSESGSGGSAAKKARSRKVFGNGRLQHNLDQLGLVTGLFDDMNDLVAEFDSAAATYWPSSSMTTTLDFCKDADGSVLMERLVEWFVFCSDAAMRENGYKAKLDRGDFFVRVRMNSLGDKKENDQKLDNVKFDAYVEGPLTRANIAKCIPSFGGVPDPMRKEGGSLVVIHAVNDYDEEMDLDSNYCVARYEDGKQTDFVSYRLSLFTSDTLREMAPFVYHYDSRPDCKTREIALPTDEELNTKSYREYMGIIHRFDKAICRALADEKERLNSCEITGHHMLFRLDADIWRCESEALALDTLEFRIAFGLTLPEVQRDSICYCAEVAHKVRLLAEDSQRTQASSLSYVFFKIKVYSDTGQSYIFSASARTSNVLAAMKSDDETIFYSQDIRANVEQTRNEHQQDAARAFMRQWLRGEKRAGTRPRL